MRRRSFRVTLDVPDGATIREAQDYIAEAVSVWCGQLRPLGAYGDDDPVDPMWSLDQESITVKRMKS